MLNRLKNLFTSSEPTGINPRVITQNEHKLEKRQVSPGALRIIDELQAAGFQAYLVGGGVRDLLLSGRPKDFDVATDARPEQVQQVFKRARIIGRRFKIVHVRMGREVIEVTTFRGSHTESKGKQSVQSDKGVLLRDNVYGSIESDAIRRDFTINALYYDPKRNEVLDFTGAMDDLKTRTLRIIGDPDARYKEDPVRMLRAIRFACKLQLEISEETEAPIRHHGEYMREVASARLFEEVLKLFLSGYAENILELLIEFELLPYLFPGAARFTADSESPAAKLIQIATHNTDARIRSEKRVTPAFIYAAFLWPALQEQIQKLQASAKISPQEALHQAADGIIAQQMAATSIPKRFQIPMREIWVLQYRLTRRDAKRAFGLLDHPRFRAAYDFMLIREESGEITEGLGEWWTRFQHAERDAQMALIESARNSGGAANKPKRRRRRKKPEAE